MHSLHDWNIDGVGTISRVDVMTIGNNHRAKIRLDIVQLQRRLDLIRPEVPLPDVVTLNVKASWNNSSKGAV
jgi:hypothetical protein